MEKLQLLLRTEYKITYLFTYRPIHQTASVGILLTTRAVHPCSQERERNILSPCIKVESLKLNSLLCGVLNAVPEPHLVCDVCWQGVPEESGALVECAVGSWRLRKSC